MTADLGMADDRLRGLWPEIRFAYVADHPGHDALLTCTYRSPADQLVAFAKGRQRDADGAWVVVNRKAIVTNCDGTVIRSRHNHLPALALDFAILIHGKLTWDEAEYEPVGLLAEARGLAWGGRWASPHDCPHIEIPPDTTGSV